MTRRHDDEPTTHVPAPILGKMSLSLAGLGLLLVGGCAEPVVEGVSPVQQPRAVPSEAPAPTEPGVPVEPAADPGTEIVSAGEPIEYPGCRQPDAEPAPKVAQPSIEPAPAEPELPEIDNCPACGRG